ncbi:MAG: hypothetical protein JWQ71_2578 [Pedosphaera sp.]|nr:hypothetical protein [Pedosphaera sp.]
MVSRHVEGCLEVTVFIMSKTPPNQSAAANRQPVPHAGSDGSGYFVSDLALPPAMNNFG